MMDSLNKQIEMQDMFNWRMKLTALEEQKTAIEHEIEKIKRILYGKDAEPEKEDEKRKIAPITHPVYQAVRTQRSRRKRKDNEDNE